MPSSALQSYSSLPHQQLRLCNQLGASRTPFLFIADARARRLEVYPLSSLPAEICFQLPGHPAPSHTPSATSTAIQIRQRHPVSQEHYRQAFNRVQEAITAGETYLLNLTFATAIELDPPDLSTLFHQAAAPYKLLYQDQFLSFSPEPFVRIAANRIHTFPMKGTAPATEPQALQMLLNNPKEQAEHTMVVDLLRNDLSRVATGVRVARFRYPEAISSTAGKQLWQTSSEIIGDLSPNWPARLGNILGELLPAGSVTGTPKQRTCQIIQAVEDDDRGWFTGVFGLFDGHSLDSGVLIRWIEKRQDGCLWFRSGGGITSDSDWQGEYEEMLEKIYVPLL